VQFFWWEVLLVKQTRKIHDDKEKLRSLGVSDSVKLKKELREFFKNPPSQRLDQLMHPLR